MATYQEQLERNRLQREAKEKAEAERKARQLSPDQIKNWRQILAHTPIGPFAYIMPNEMVQDFYEIFQREMAAEYPPDAAPIKEKGK